MLRAMFGQDEANHGTTRYCVGPSGLVLVPPKAAEHLLKRGGFTVATVRPSSEPISPPLGPAAVAFVTVRHKSAQGCSYGGKTYRSDERGMISVPAEAVGELVDHGFIPADVDAATRKLANTENRDETC